jgi:hypothetical protein
MPFIGETFSCGCLCPQIRELQWFRGLAQRNKGRKTSYIDDRPASTRGKKTGRRRGACRAAIQIHCRRAPPCLPDSALFKDVDAPGWRNTTAKTAARTATKPF